MIVGNSKSKELLQKYLDIFTSDREDKPQFFLLTGPTNVGKSSMAIEMIKEILWDYYNTDFLHIKDLSNYIGKQHVLKVKLPDDKSKHFMEYEDIETWIESRYNDLGTREINEWLNKSPFGKYKVLLIENIDRMNLAAANAFLKTCEEPLPNRLIIATTAHSSQLLDTIVSRALIIRFNSITNEELTTFCTQHNLVSDANLKEFLVNMSMGRPGLLVKLSHMLDNNSDLKREFVDAIKLLSTWWNYFKTQSLLSKINQDGSISSFLDWWISYCTDKGMFEESQKWLKIKKILNSNVNTENLLLYWVLD